MKDKSSFICCHYGFVTLSSKAVDGAVFGYEARGKSMSIVKYRGPRTLDDCKMLPGASRIAESADDAFKIQFHVAKGATSTLFITDCLLTSRLFASPLPFFWLLFARS